MLLTVTLNASVDKLYLLDENIPGTVMRVREVRNSAGGKGMNVSRVALVGRTGDSDGLCGRIYRQILRIADHAAARRPGVYPYKRRNAQLH